MTPVTCNWPGTWDCIYLNIIWFFILGPVEALFDFFGLTFTWELYRD